MADLNALIAQGAKFDMPNPINQMAQMMQMRHLQDQSALAPVQLQHAQQQNQMNQLLMQEKQRGFQEQNAVRTLMGRPGFTLADPEHVRELHYTAPNLADPIYKNYLANAKMLGDINAQPGEVAYKKAQTSDLNEKTLDAQLTNFNKVFSPLSVNNPEDVKAYTMAMYNDPKLGPLAAQMKSLDEALQTNLAEFAKNPKMWQAAHAQLSGKDIFDALKGTRQNVALGNVNQGSTIDAFGNVVPGSQTSTAIGAVPSTDAAMMQARAAQQQAGTSAARLKWEQENPGFSVHMTDQGPVAVNNKDPSKVKQITLDGQPLGKPLANIPAAANKAMISNEQNLSLAKTALALAEGKTVGEVKGDIAATGWKGVLSDEMLQRMDPEGVNTRAYIADLGSMIVHDRSGAAVTASEMPRLKPFIPKSTDTAEAVQDKLKRFIRAFEQENNLYNETYGKEQGYRPRSKANPSTAVTHPSHPGFSVAPAGAP